MIPTILYIMIAGAYKIRSFFVMLQWLLLQVMVRNECDCAMHWSHSVLYTRAVVLFPQVNLLALSWSRDGHFIKVAEEVIVCLLLVHCVVVILLGIYAVRTHAYTHSHMCVQVHVLEDTHASILPVCLYSMKCPCGLLALHKTS